MCVGSRRHEPLHGTGGAASVCRCKTCYLVAPKGFYYLTGREGGAGSAAGAAWGCIPGPRGRARS